MGRLIYGTCRPWVSVNWEMKFERKDSSTLQEGKYREALGKWETAITLSPDVPVLHEQKAQVLLEIGEAWNALKAAIRATELKPSWAEAWVTLGRAQLNYGEPDNAIESFDRALSPKALKAKEAQKKVAQADEETGRLLEGIGKVMDQGKRNDQHNSFSLHLAQYLDLND
ncbi:tetratricopeptide repeat protein [Trifolium repens]|nr:tetratricopeptide repeat protein [Trifolium repens]